MSSGSEAIWRYARERLLTGRVLALTALTALLAGAYSARSELLATVFTAMLVLALRVLDDLIDLHHDRVHHPHRVLTQACELRRLQLLAGVVLLLAGLTVAHASRVSAPSVMIGLALALIVLYLPIIARPVREVGLLAKYPALVLAASSSHTSAPWAAGALYLGLLAASVVERTRGWRRAPGR